MDKKPKKIGRPTSYRLKLAKRICDLIATHAVGLRTLTANHDWMPTQSTINKWLWKHEEFSLLYARAKVAQAAILPDECLDIADDTSQDTNYKTNKDGEEYEVANNEWINRSRLRVDVRKWLSAQLLPRIWGSAQRVEDLEGQNDVLRQELRTLRAELDAKSQKEF